MTLTDGNVSISENLGYKDLGEIMVTTDGTDWKPLKKTTIANMWTNQNGSIDYNAIKNQFYIPLGNKIGYEFWHLNPFTELNERKVVTYLTLLSNNISGWKNDAIANFPNDDKSGNTYYYMYIGKLEDGNKHLFIQVKVNNTTTPIDSVKVLAGEGKQVNDSDAHDVITKSKIYENNPIFKGGKKKSKKSKKVRKSKKVKKSKKMKKSKKSKKVRKSKK